MNQRMAFPLLTSLFFLGLAALPATAATVVAKDFQPLIEAIPAPPADLRQALTVQEDPAAAARFEELDQRIAILHQSLSGVTASEAAGVAAMIGVTQAAVEMPKTPEEAAALQKKLEAMSPQQKMAFAMRLQQQQMQAAMRSHAAHAVAPLPPEMQEAYDELLALDRQLRPLPGEGKNRFAGPLYAATDAKLDRQLTALGKQYPAVPVKGNYGSDPDSYYHANHLCHQVYDTRIKRAQAAQGIYDAWLGARRQVWEKRAQEITSVIDREESLLEKIAYGEALQQAGDTIGYRNMIKLRQDTLYVIDELAAEARVENLPDADALDIAGLKAAREECLTLQ